MFQATGIHGPVLGPLGSLVLDVVLLGIVFWTLLSSTKRRTSDIILFASIIAGVSLLRVIMTPLPNIQPVTIAALLVGPRSRYPGPTRLHLGPTLREHFRVLAYTLAHRQNLKGQAYNYIGSFPLE